MRRNPNQTNQWKDGNILNKVHGFDILFPLVFCFLSVLRKKYAYYTWKIWDTKLATKHEVNFKNLIVVNICGFKLMDIDLFTGRSKFLADIEIDVEVTCVTF